MELALLKYKIPFNKPFHTSSKIYEDREGIVIKLKKNGITALGEAAPLPGFSEEALPAVINEIQQKRRKIEQLFQSNLELNDLNRINLSSSLQFGIFSAAATYLAQKKQSSLHDFLFENSANEVQMNAVIHLNGKNILPQIEQFVREGFDTIKIKTGVNWETTISQLKKIGSEFENIAIRLDANQSWGLEKAKRNLKQAESHLIQYCEEPLKNPSPQKLKLLKNYTTIPVALDETMVKWPEIKENAGPADILIIKPTVTGSKKAKKIYNFASKNEKHVVFTTSLGTGIERLITATLAAGFGSSKLAHGLSTGGLLQKDVWKDDQCIKNGKYKLPEYEQLKELMQSNLQNISTEII